MRRRQREAVALTSSLLERVLVPIANAADTEATCRAIEPYLDDVGEIILVHVVEQTPGFVDQSPPDALREDAQAFLGQARDRLGEGILTRAEIRFGTDVAEEIAALAEEASATAIVFRPRDKGLLASFVDGDNEGELIRASPVPVIALTS